MSNNLWSKMMKTLMLTPLKKLMVSMMIMIMIIAIGVMRMRKIIMMTLKMKKTPRKIRRRPLIRRIVRMSMVSMGPRAVTMTYLMLPKFKKLYKCLNI